jgi:GT2 family glycosyltransferase
MKSSISVIVVTYNRPKDAKDTIDSLTGQSAPPLEIIVIDDASNPPFTLESPSDNVKLHRFEQEVGVSAARNHGIHIANGEYVAFIDDDAVADLHWLSEFQAGIALGADVLGGPIEPLYLASPPAWWNEKDFGHYVSIGNAPNKYRDFTPGIWSANMVLKKEIVKTIGNFNTQIGRQRGRLLAREDVELVNRAKERGYKILFLPNAIVHHKVRSERLTIPYLLRWEYYMGQTQKILRRHDHSRTFIGICESVVSLILSILFGRSRVLKATARLIQNLGRL